MKNRKEKKKGIKGYMIVIILFICMFGLSIVNQSEDGELNDYEIYEPLIVEDEEIEINEGEELAENLEEILPLFISITFFAVAFSTFILPLFRDIDSF